MEYPMQYVCSPQKVYTFAEKKQFLEILLVNKDILNRKNVGTSAKNTRLHCWKHILTECVKLGIFPDDKDHCYVRDIFWPNLRRSTLTKKDKYDNTVDPTIVFTAIDEMVMQFLADDDDDQQSIDNDTNNVKQHRYDEDQQHNLTAAAPLWPSVNTDQPSLTTPSYVMQQSYLPATLLTAAYQPPHTPNDNGGAFADDVKPSATEISAIATRSPHCVARVQHPTHGVPVDPPYTATPTATTTAAPDCVDTPQSNRAGAKRRRIPAPSLGNDGHGGIDYGGKLTAVATATTADGDVVATSWPDDARPLSDGDDGGGDLDGDAECRRLRRRKLRLDVENLELQNYKLRLEIGRLKQDMNVA